MPPKKLIIIIVVVVIVIIGGVSLGFSGIFDNNGDRSSFGDPINSENPTDPGNPTGPGKNPDNGKKPDPGKTPDSSNHHSDNSYIVAGYYTNWGIYDRKFFVNDLKPNQMTHIIYAFALPGKDGAVSLGDAEADINYLFKKENTVNGIADAPKKNDKDLRGNLKQLGLLKKKYRHVKVSLSIGGWDDSANFATLAADEASRKKFAQTAVQHVINLGLDGIDIDWEYPNDEKDAANFVLLLKEVRQGLDNFQKTNKSDNEPFLLSIAAPAGAEQFKKLKLKEMTQYVDIFYLMTYDFAGDFDDVTGYQSALYGGKLNVDLAVKGFKDAGVPSKKIVMGMPVYGRAFSGAKNATGSPYHGVPKGTWEKGMYDYRDLPQQHAVEYYDSKNIAAWSYDDQKKEFVTYDSTQVVAVKCDYIQKNGLGGAMLWELSGDATGKRSILDTIYGKLGSNMIKTNNHIVYPKDSAISSIS